MEISFIESLFSLLEKHGPLALSLIIFIALYIYSDRKNREDRTQAIERHTEERKDWKETHSRLTERSIECMDKTSNAITELTKAIAVENTKKQQPEPEREDDI
jgi:hypothetical protein